MNHMLLWLRYDTRNLLEENIIKILSVNAQVASGGKKRKGGGNIKNR